MPPQLQSLETSHRSRLVYLRDAYTIRDTHSYRVPLVVITRGQHNSYFYICQNVMTTVFDFITAGWIIIRYYLSMLTSWLICEAHPRYITRKYLMLLCAGFNTEYVLYYSKCKRGWNQYKFVCCIEKREKITPNFTWLDIFAPKNATDSFKVYIACLLGYRLTFNKITRVVCDFHILRTCRPNDKSI